MSDDRKKLIKRYAFLCCSVLIAIIIFCFSSQTATESDKESRGFLWELLCSIPYFAAKSEGARLAIIDSIHTLVRKTAHFSIYASLGMCVINYILTYISTKKKAFVISLLICFLYASSDEIHQLFVPGRSGEVRDVLIDTCGAIVGMCLVLLVMCVFNTLRRRKSE